MILFVQPMFQLLTLLITALASYYLIRSVVKLSPAEMARMSAAYLGYNPEIGKSFALQKAETVVGFALLMISVLVQIWTISQPLRFVDVDGLNLIQIVFAMCIFVVIYKLTEYIRQRLTKRYLESLLQDLKTAQE